MEGVCTSIQMAGLRYITHFWWDPRPFHPYALRPQDWFR